MLQVVAAAVVGVGAITQAPSLLVTPQWLEDHLDDPRVVVLHASMEQQNYDAGHVPGARFAPLMEFHAHRQADQLLPPAELAAAIGRLGVTNQDRVVIVGDPMGAAILFVAFDYVGHGDKTAILDGGIAGWRAAGGKVVNHAAPFPKATFTATVRQDLVVDAAWIKSRLGSPTLALLDARSEREYLGTTEAEGLPRYGHIPGAGHLEWTATLTAPAPAKPAHSSEPTLEGATILGRSVLEQRFRAAGADPDDVVVAYCTVGMRASHLYFVARLLGRKAHLYVGSMADWSRKPELPMVGPKATGQP
jgi:thiosulfate/3-mercaptopyruvate sulfurtransferase